MSVQFTYHGSVPSKSNFRRGGKDWRKSWARIKAFEKDIGLLALASGARRVKGEVEVSMLLINQRLDTDNAAKIVCDSLEGVCFSNDRQVSKVVVGREKRPKVEPSVDVEIREAS